MLILLTVGNTNQRGDFYSFYFIIFYFFFTFSLLLDLLGHLV